MYFDRRAFFAAAFSSDDAVDLPLAQVLASIAPPDAAVIVPWTDILSTNFPNADPALHPHAPSLCPPPSPTPYTDFVEAIYVPEPVSLYDYGRVFLDVYDPNPAPGTENPPTQVLNYLSFSRLVRPHTHRH